MLPRCQEGSGTACGQLHETAAAISIHESQRPASVARHNFSRARPLFLSSKK
jgi:hypothetical protein